MIKQVELNTKHIQRLLTYKFGVQILRKYKEEMELYVNISNRLCDESIQIDLKPLVEYNEFQDKGKYRDTPPNYIVIHLHPIFDCKHNFMRKTRMVAEVHMIETPSDTNYSSVVSLRRLRMFMFMSELNWTSIIPGDIGTNI